MRPYQRIIVKKIKDYAPMIWGMHNCSMSYRGASKLVEPFQSVIRSFVKMTFAKKKKKIEKKIWKLEAKKLKLGLKTENWKNELKTENWKNFRPLPKNWN